MRDGVRIGVDVGGVRVGVARCDRAGILATPVATLRRGKDDLTGVVKLARAEEALEVIVGLPLNMDGSEGGNAQDARRWAGKIARRLKSVPVRLVDERLTTVSAHSLLHEAGMRESAHRSVVDQQAAVIILENALDIERRTGRPPGELVGSPEENLRD